MTENGQIRCQLTDAQRYAAAALFSLALYRSQDVAWRASCEDATLWGIPSTIDPDTFDDEEASKLQHERSAWELFWGWDLIGPGGLLDHICDHLGLNAGTRMGIKRLVEQHRAPASPGPPHGGPQGAPQGPSRPRVSFDAVTTFTSMLAVSSARVPKTPSQPLPDVPISELRADAEASSAAAETHFESTADGQTDRVDLEGDVEGGIELKPLAQPAAQQSAQSAGGAASESSNAVTESTEAERLADIELRPVSKSMGTGKKQGDWHGNAGEGEQHGNADTDGQSQAEDAQAATQAVGGHGAERNVATEQQAVSSTKQTGADTAACLPQHTQHAGHTGTSVHSRAQDAQQKETSVHSSIQGDADEKAAVRAVCRSALEAVFRSVISRDQMPMLDTVLKRTQGQEGALSQRFTYLSWPEHTGTFHLVPRVRWYDARARTALKEIATWLRIDPAVLYEFEAVYADAVWSPERRAALQKQPTARSKGLKYLAVGAAAVTGGTLVAVTGGLAAPVVAGAVSPLLTGLGIAGVGAAMTSFVGSSAGAALIMTALGSYGASYAGGKVLRRLGDVKEFGFREIIEGSDFIASDGFTASPSASVATLDPSEGPSQGPSAGPAGSSVSSDMTSQTDNNTTNNSNKPPVPRSSVAMKLQRMMSPRNRLSRSGRQAAATLSQSSLSSASQQTQGTQGTQGDCGVAEQTDGQTEGQGRWLPEGAEEDRIDPVKPGSISYRSCGQQGTEATESSTRSGQSAVSAGQQSVNSSSTTTSGIAGSTSTATDGARDSTGAVPVQTAFAGHSAGEQNVGKGSGSGENSVGGDGEGSGSGGGKGMGKQGSMAKSGSSRSWSLNWRQRSPRPAPLLPVPLTASATRQHRLAVSIGIHGWVRNPQDFLTLWGGLEAYDCQRFSLVWESAELMKLSTALWDTITSTAGQTAAKWFARTFVAGAATVLAALALPMGIMAAFGMLDGPWGIVLDRAQKAGVLLAHVLMSACHGDRPVTLVGYSMGARLLYYCLHELADYNALGIVENAVLLGAPVGVDKARWARVRRVVSGRLINGHSKNDWVLGIGYRSGSGFLRLAAGLTAVDCPGVENVNLSEMIDGHTDYIKHFAWIMETLGL